MENKRQLFVYGPIVLIPFLVVSFFLFTLYQGSKDLKVSNFGDIEIVDANRQNSNLYLLLANKAGNDIQIQNLTIRGQKFRFLKVMNNNQTGWINTGYEIDRGIKIFDIKIDYINLELESSHTSSSRVEGLF